MEGFRGWRVRMTEDEKATRETEAEQRREEEFDVEGRAWVVEPLFGLVTLDDEQAQQQLERMRKTRSTRRIVMDARKRRGQAGTG